MRCPHCGRRISRIRQILDRAGARIAQSPLLGVDRAPAPYSGEARQTSGRDVSPGGPSGISRNPLRIP